MTTVLHVNKAYYPHTGGIEAVAQSLAEGLTRRGEFPCRVLASGPQRRTRHTVVNGVPVTYVGSLRTVASLPLSPTYPFWLNRQRSKIVHVHLPFPLADLSLWLLASLRRLPSSTGIVLHWHSDVVRQRWAMPLYAPLLRWLLRRADRIVVASPNHVTSSAVLPEFASKCCTIPYGVDLHRFEPTPDVLAEANAIRQGYGSRLVLFVGRLVYYKGVEYLVEAMARVPDATLVIAGSGALRERLQDLAVSSGIGDRVQFLGSVGDERLIALYHAADVFVLPSVEKSEAFGIVQLEAMACGKPVVTSDLPTGVTYVNRHGITGLTVSPRDSDQLSQAIRSLLDDPDTARRMGEAARLRVRSEFTLDQMIERTAQLYRQVLAETGH